MRGPWSKCWENWSPLNLSQIESTQIFPTFQKVHLMSLMQCFSKAGLRSAPDEYGSEREKDDCNSSDEDDILKEKEGFSVSGGEFY